MVNRTLVLTLWAAVVAENLRRGAELPDTLEGERPCYY